MKIRTDFVSNSSSCSFVIEDIAGGLKALNELDILDSLSYYDIRVQYLLKTEVFDKFDTKKHESWRDKEEDVVYCKCEPNEVAQLPVEVKMAMTELELECDDCNQGAVLILVLIREALSKMGIQVDDTRTEIDLPSFGDNTLAGKLINCIGKYGKGQK